MEAGAGQRESGGLMNQSRRPKSEIRNPKKKGFPASFRPVLWCPLGLTHDEFLIIYR